MTDYDIHIKNGTIVDGTRAPKYRGDIWLKDGRIKYQETVVDGFERAPEGLIGLFEGRNTGKMLINVAD